MLDVLIFAVNNTEESETTTINWLNWDENMKMIIEFDFKFVFSSRIWLIQWSIVLSMF
jgi:hypothetical protein